MKRILIALAVLATASVVAGAQNLDKAKAALDAAVEAANNPKKAAKAATWLKLGDAYVAAHDAPSSDLETGVGKDMLKMMGFKEEPTSTENVTLAGTNYVKESYSGRNLYFAENGNLAFVEPTQVVDADALSKAADAYAKASELGAKSSDVSSRLQSLNGKYINDAFNEYQLGNLTRSSELFEQAASVAAAEPLSILDTNSVYNAGFIAWLNKDYGRAKGFLSECREVGYYSNGDIFSKLADCDTTNAKGYLEEGFQLYPDSQSILIGLINYYLSHNEDPEKLFTLLDKAKQNEPNNASLYYVEGNIRKQLGQEDKAVAAYKEANKIDANYEYGEIGLGMLYYDKALALQDAASKEYDDAKYQALVSQFEDALKSGIEPFEKAYNISKDNGIRVTIAEYLKNIYYRFSSNGDEYMEGYKKYSHIVETGVAE